MNNCRLLTLLGLALVGLSSVSAYNRPYTFNEIMDSKSYQDFYPLSEAYPLLSQKLVTTTKIGEPDYFGHREDFYPDNLEDYFKLAVELSDKKPNSKLSYAANLFIKLAGSIQRCDLDSFRALISNYGSAAAGRQLMNPSDDKISELVFEAISNHDFYCSAKYLGKFNGLYDGLDDEVREQVEVTLDEDAINRIFSRPDIQGRIREVDLWDNLNRLGAFGQRARETDQIPGLDKLKEPCKRFYDQFAEIYLPFRLIKGVTVGDMKISESESQNEFYQIWLRFRVCAALIWEAPRPKEKKVGCFGGLFGGNKKQRQIGA